MPKWSHDLHNPGTVIPVPQPLNSWSKIKPCNNAVKLVFSNNESIPDIYFSWLHERLTIINPSTLLAGLEYAMSFVGQASVRKGLIGEIHISYVHVLYTSWMPFVITLRIVFSKPLQRQTKGFISWQSKSSVWPRQHSTWASSPRQGRCLQKIHTPMLHQVSPFLSRQSY